MFVAYRSLLPTVVCLTVVCCPPNLCVESTISRCTAPPGRCCGPPQGNCPQLWQGTVLQRRWGAALQVEPRAGCACCWASSRVLMVVLASLCPAGCHSHHPAAAGCRPPRGPLCAAVPARGGRLPAWPQGLPGTRHQNQGTAGINMPRLRINMLGACAGRLLAAGLLQVHACSPRTSCTMQTPACWTIAAAGRAPAAVPHVILRPAQAGPRTAPERPWVLPIKCGAPC